MLSLVHWAVIPHVTTEDDVYNGYRIPKGAVVIPVVWSVDTFPAFEPLRTLTSLLSLLQENGS